MRAREFYETVLLLLKDMAAGADVSEYFRPEAKYDLEHSAEVVAEDVFECLIISLQNRQAMPNVVKYGRYRARYKKILCGFDAALIFEKYQNAPDGVFEGEEGIPELSASLRAWGRYVVSAADFMRGFGSGREGAKNIKRAFDAFQSVPSDLGREALPLLLANKIKGLGFALACDFLKEIGYDYPKPDVHIRAVFEAYRARRMSDGEVFDDLMRTAKEAGVSAYELDKAVWLVCSGHFYLRGGKKYKGRKDELIEKVRAKGVRATDFR